MVFRLFSALALIATLSFAGLFAATPAMAAWHKAESERFVIYSDSSERDVRTFAERLERYHVAMTIVTGFKPPVPSPSNRVTVYAVGSGRDLRKLYGDKSSSVAGFYIPRAGGSVAFVPNVKMGTRETDFTMIVLMHEYAHHFWISSTSHAFPRWMVEGSAEFFASVKFEKDGGLDIGLPANHRIGDLNYAEKLSIREILDYDRIAGTNGLRNDGFYGQAWLLFHYVMFNEERLPQYSQYARAYMRGTPSLQAAEEAFGDLDQLEKELKAYQRSRRIPAMRLTADVLPIGAISVVELSDGMDEMMDVIVQSRRGVTREEALELLPEARKIAAKYPDDAGVLTALAEAEYDAGNDAEAIAAADKAIALDPMRTNAYVQKGFALFRIAKDAEGDGLDNAFANAMSPFEKLNAIEADHPMPLIYNYRSFVERGVPPDENARAGLLRASQLAPFDQDLRLNAAMMLISNTQNSDARLMLRPLAASPHGGGSSSRAKSLLALLERTPDGTRLDLSQLSEVAGGDGEAEGAADE